MHLIQCQAPVTHALTTGHLAHAASKMPPGNRNTLNPVEAQHKADCSAHARRRQNMLTGAHGTITSTALQKLPKEQVQCCSLQTSSNSVSAGHPSESPATSQCFRDHHALMLR